MMASVSAAHISGPLGQALAVIDGQTWLYEVAREPRHPESNDIRFFFDHGIEVRALVPEERPTLSPAELSSCLQAETRCFRAMQDLLIGMDTEIDDDLRLRSMRRADRLLGDQHVAAFIDRRFLRPITNDSWDPAGATRLARAEKLFRPMALYNIVVGSLLVGLEDKIRQWAKGQKLTSLATAALLDHSYEHGLIAAFATALRDNTPVHGLIFLAKPLGWDAHLIAYIAKSYASTMMHGEGKVIDDENVDERDRFDPTDIVAATRASITQALDARRSRRRRGGSRERGGRVGASALDSVLQQVDWIAEQFRQGHTLVAWRAVGDLAERQLREATPELLAQSLTNLATRLEVRGQVGLGLCDLAALCAPDDPAIANARAELLRELGCSEEALAAYDETVARFTDDVFARTGRAETLRELGRTEEALVAYDEGVLLFQDNVVARNGRAETLRELGRSEEALAIYTDTIQRFSNEVVPRNGQAETLRELGRTEEALAVYTDTVQRFPDDAVTRNGQAETLRELGRTEEALAVYTDTARRFPNSAFTRNGQAAILAELGRFNEARQVLSAVVAEPRAPSEWVAHHILCTIDLRCGADTALAERLQHLVASCPYPAQRRYFETTLAVVRVALRQTAEARNTLEALVARQEVAPSERATLHLMKAHAEAADGDLGAARHSLHEAATIVPYEEFRAKQLRREIERRYGLGGQSALTQPAEIVQADAVLVELETAFVTARMGRLGGGFRRAA